jgi:hypothetical protein
MIYVRTAYNQQREFAVEQPVAFDHRHHVHDDGIECLYCHSAAARSAVAGVPPTELCMGCHAQVWNRSPKLALVRDSYDSGLPIAWKRVHSLPGFVYFNHAVHVNAGVDCQHCHGDVASMPQVQKVTSLSMGFCLDCHREPAQHVPGYRKLPEIDAIGSQPSGVVDNHLITCTACHR